MPKNTKTEISDEYAEQILFGAMQLHGMLPPSIEEVATIDAELASFELPFTLPKASELLERLVSVRSAKNMKISPTSAFEAPCISNLAQAARDGGELTEEVKQQMARDKDKFLREEHNDR